MANPVAAPQPREWEEREMARPLTYQEFQFDARDSRHALLSMLATLVQSDPRYRYVDEGGPCIVTANVPLTVLKRYRTAGGYRLPEPLSVTDEMLEEMGLKQPTGHAPAAGEE